GMFGFTSMSVFQRAGPLRSSCVFYLFIVFGRLWSVGRALDRPLAELVAPLDAAARGRGAGRPPIALVGLRGAGKSTIGRRVSERLNRPFVELDAQIESAAGLPLSQVFEIHGETYYRRLEREALDRFLRTQQEGSLLATGGGIVTDPDSWAMLRTQAITVWLRAEPEDHYRRVMEQGDLRPMKNRPGAMAELRVLLAARNPLYAQSQIVIETSQLGLNGAIEAVCRAAEAVPTVDDMAVGMRT
ncbi:MAG: shikimate kinase, partial [Myxococcota bacterium]